MTSFSDEMVLALIGSFYKAAKEQSVEYWSNVFQGLLDVLSSGPGCLSLYSSNNKRFNLFVSTLDKDFVEEYNTHFQYISPFRNQILQMNAGDRFSRAEHCPDNIFREKEFYREYLWKQDIFNYEYQMLFKKAETVVGVLFSRPERMKNFNVREIKLMQLIMPHLKRALQIQIKFLEIQKEKKVLFECFESFSQGIVVINKSGKIIFLNKIADKLIINRDGFQSDRDGILSAISLQDSTKLNKMLRSVFEPDLNQIGNLVNVLQISRTSGLRPLSVVISPFSENNENIFDCEKLAILFITNTEQKIEHIEPILQQLYGLTPAESKIARILTEGKSLDEACNILGIKPNTIRTHLKRIFSKTDTNRQSELVKLTLSNILSVKT